jgi:transcriptional regulator with XRE-family HTH domain
MIKENQASADVRVIVGGQVHRLRKEVSLTQDVVAHRCGIFRTYLSRIENGTANPTITVLAALAKTLGVPISALFNE